MLERILDHIHNYFEKEVVEGTFTISDGVLNVDFLQDGQYFRIRGSVFNDGVYKYPAYELRNETFTGSVWAMAVPPAVIALCEEIEDWQKKYGEVTSSPYQSESFGGYSYSKASGGSVMGNGANTGVTWENMFATRLNAWRKI